MMRTVGGGMEPPRAGTDVTTPTGGTTVVGAGDTVTTPTGGILLTGAGGREASGYEWNY